MGSERERVRCTMLRWTRPSAMALSHVSERLSGLHAPDSASPGACDFSCLDAPRGLSKRTLHDASTGGSTVRGTAMPMYGDAARPTTPALSWKAPASSSDMSWG